jgi:hypothetical protein
MQSTGNEFRYVYVASCLSWTGHDLVKIRKYATALILFQAAAHKAKEYSNPIAFSSYSFKQLYIQIHLDLARCHLALGSMSNAKLALDTLRAFERALSLTYDNPRFLEMANLTKAIDKQTSNLSKVIPENLFQDIPTADDKGLPRFPQCFYQVSWPLI